MSVEVKGLFPTPFLRVTGLLGKAQVEALIAELRASRTDGNAKSRGLSHTRVVTPESSALYRAVAERLEPRLGDFGELLFGERLKWSVKEMWMNLLETGGRQALHNHANSFASGVVYLTRCHDSARTVLYRDLGGRDFAFRNDHDAARPGPYNSPKWVIPEVAPGDLVVFPSYLLHEVPENQGPERISLAFNAVPERLVSWGYELRFQTPS